MALMKDGLWVFMLVAAGWCSSGDAAAAEPVRVTLHNFVRAESDTYFAKMIGDGGFAKFAHERELAPLDRQTVIRMNRDTLYSYAVLDLAAAPATVVLPDAGPRYMAIQVINQDHYTLDVLYQPGPHRFDLATVGTRYVMLLVRTLVNPNDPADVRAVHALQDGLRIEQADGGKVEFPNWDQASLKAIRDALNAVVAANGGLDSPKMFGRRDAVDPIDHLFGTAAGWGGNPRETALYVGVNPPENDGQTAYTLTLRDVPVDGFWSISVYNQAGFFDPDPKFPHSYNSLTAKKNNDGSVTIRFGGDRTATNFLPITPGWNYLVRMYRPRKEVLDGTWKLPEARLVK